MNLQEILQIIGGVGVIGSLIYVAVQIRNNARALRAATYLQLSHSMTEALYNMASNGELADLVLRGGEDFAALPRLDKARFRFHAMFVLSFNQNVFFQRKIGTLTSHDWDSFSNDLVSYFDMRGARQAWGSYKKRFNPEFQAHVDNIIEDIEREKSSVELPVRSPQPPKKLRRRKSSR